MNGEFNLLEIDNRLKTIIAATIKMADATKIA